MILPVIKTAEQRVRQLHGPTPILKVCHTSVNAAGCKRTGWAEMSSVCRPFSDRCDPHRGPGGQESRGPDREQWPHIMLPELPQADEGTRPEHCGEYITRPGSQSSEEKLEKKEINGAPVCFVSLQWGNLCLKISGNLEKVQEQRDLASFFFDTAPKSLNLLSLNKSDREHNKMVMFHVCQMKAFHVDDSGFWLNERHAFAPPPMWKTAQFFLRHCSGSHFQR